MGACRAKVLCSRSLRKGSTIRIWTQLTHCFTSPCLGIYIVFLTVIISSWTTLQTPLPDKLSTPMFRIYLCSSKRGDPSFCVVQMVDDGIWKFEYRWWTSQNQIGNLAVHSWVCLVCVELWLCPGLKQKLGFGLSSITCPQAGAWCFMNSKWDSMSGKQFVKHRAILKWVICEALPGECRIEKIGGDSG